LSTWARGGRSSSFQLARRRAAVSVIVTFFSGLNKTIATTSGLALVRTRVSVVAISVVAFLARLLNTVAAFRKRAVVAASVVVDSVSVIALLAWLDKPITTLGVRAIVGARGIVVVVVAVIAFLNTILDNAIATSSVFAFVGACVSIIVVAVVAVFSIFDNSIATNSGVIASAVVGGRGSGVTATRTKGGYVGVSLKFLGEGLLDTVVLY
jgi:hypothetical protein